MSETTTSRRNLWFAVVAVLAAAAVWATVAMAAGGSGSAGTGAPTTAYTTGPHAQFAAGGDRPHQRGDCPNMGGDSGGSATPSTPSAPATPSAPSTEDGSSNPAF